MKARPPVCSRSVPPLRLLVRDAMPRLCCAFRSRTVCVPVVKRTGRPKQRMGSGLSSMHCAPVRACARAGESRRCSSCLRQRLAYGAGVQSCSAGRIILQKLVERTGPARSACNRAGADLSLRPPPALSCGGCPDCGSWSLEQPAARAMSPSPATGRPERGRGPRRSSTMRLATERLGVHVTENQRTTSTWALVPKGSGKINTSAHQTKEHPVTLACH